MSDLESYPRWEASHCFKLSSGCRLLTSIISKMIITFFDPIKLFPMKLLPILDYTNLYGIIRELDDWHFTFDECTTNLLYVMLVAFFHCLFFVIGLAAISKLIDNFHCKGMIKFSQHMDSMAFHTAYKASVYSVFD